MRQISEFRANKITGICEMEHGEDSIVQRGFPRSPCAYSLMAAGNAVDVQSKTLQRCPNNTSLYFIAGTEKVESE